jgi:hypothetical protein
MRNPSSFPGFWKRAITRELWPVCGSAVRSSHAPLGCRARNSIKALPPQLFPQSLRALWPKGRLSGFSLHDWRCRRRSTNWITPFSKLDEFACSLQIARHCRSRIPIIGRTRPLCIRPITDLYISAANLARRRAPPLRHAAERALRDLTRSLYSPRSCAVRLRPGSSVVADAGDLRRIMGGVSTDLGVRHSSPFELPTNEPLAKPRGSSICLQRKPAKTRRDRVGAEGASVTPIDVTQRGFQIAAEVMTQANRTLQRTHRAA